MSEARRIEEGRILPLLPKEVHVFERAPGAHEGAYPRRRVRQSDVHQHLDTGLILFKRPTCNQSMLELYTRD